MKRAALLALAVLTSSCQGRRDAGEVVVSVIGGRAEQADPSRGPLDAPDRALIDATAQGLVRFDASGQIEPGLAERWSVIDDGRSYIFRLADAQWPDGSDVTAADVVASLRRAIAPGSRNPIKPFLSAIDEVVEMTPQVIEVRLARPRPDLLKLFAQPELAVLHPREGGSGPLRITAQTSRSLTLREMPPVAAGEDDAPKGKAEDLVLRGENAAKAVARFSARLSDLVMGGTVADWPLIAAAGVAPANVRPEYAVGLFGLAVADREGFLATPANRAAVAAAIDRAALLAPFAPGWQPVETILPESLDSGAPPVQPGWSALSQADRVASARTQVAQWRATHGGPLTLRIALPKGPGGTLLFGQIGASLINIGIQPVRVAADAPADLRLIDRVAPYDSARWYLVNACQPCSGDAASVIEAARLAPTLALRAQYIAQADTALAADVAFIPLARPLRWSLVALRLNQWQGNPRAWHPLNRLRNESR